MRHLRTFEQLPEADSRCRESVTGRVRSLKLHLAHMLNPGRLKLPCRPPFDRLSDHRSSDSWTNGVAGPNPVAGSSKEIILVQNDKHFASWHQPGLTVSNTAVHMLSSLYTSDPDKIRKAVQTIQLDIKDASKVKTVPGENNIFVVRGHGLRSVFRREKDLVVITSVSTEG